MTLADPLLFDIDARARHADQRARERGVSAADFGAKGDGVNDDTAAIQAAVVAATADGLDVVLPGHHRVSAPVVLSSGATVRCAPGAMVTPVDGAAVGAVFVNANPIDGGGDSDISVHGLRINGNSGALSTTRGVDLQYVARARVDGLDAYDMTDRAVRFFGCTDSIMTHCTARNVGVGHEQCFSIGGGSSRCIMAHCIASGGWDRDFIVAHSSDIQVLGCISRNAKGAALAIYSNTGTTVNSRIVVDGFLGIQPESQGIYLERVQDSILSNVVLYQPGAEGIRSFGVLTYMARVTIKGAVIVNPVSSGISLSAPGSQIDGAIVLDSSDYGIRLVGERMRVSNCYIHGTGDLHGLLVQGQECAVSNTLVDGSDIKVDVGAHRAQFTNVMSVNAPNYGLIANGASGDPLVGLQARGLVVKNSTAAAVRLANAQRALVSGVGISTTGSSGVSLQDVSDVVMSDLSIAGVATDGIATTAGTNTDITISNAIIDSPPGNGIAAAAANSTYTNVRVKSPGLHGIRLAAAGMRAVACDVSGAGQNAYYITGSDCALTGCLGKNSGQTGPAGHRNGVRIEGSTGTTITGCRFFDDQGTKTQEYGVREFSAADYTTLAANDLRGNSISNAQMIGANSIMGRNLGANDSSLGLVGRTTSATVLTLQPASGATANAVEIYDNAASKVTRFNASGKLLLAGKTLDVSSSGAWVYVGAGSGTLTDNGPMGVKVKLDSTATTRPDGIQSNVCLVEGAAADGACRAIVARVDVGASVGAGSSGTGDTVALWGDVFVRNPSPRPTWGLNTYVSIEAGSGYTEAAVGAEIAVTNNDNAAGNAGGAVHVVVNGTQPSRYGVKFGGASGAYTAQHSILMSSTTPPATNALYYGPMSTGNVPSGTPLWVVDKDGRMGLNASPSSLARLTLGGAMELAEQADPSAPAADRAVLFARDNGSGKTQICVRFPTGAVQVVATEP